MADWLVDSTWKGDTKAGYTNSFQAWQEFAEAREIDHLQPTEQQVIDYMGSSPGPRAAAPRV